MMSPIPYTSSLESRTVRPANSEQQGFRIKGQTIEPHAFRARHQFEMLQNRLSALGEFKENWTGYDVAAPDPKAITKAKQWVSDLFALALAQNRWLDPMASPDENGAIVFEWQQGSRWLSVTITSETVTFLREGDSLAGGYEEGIAETREQRENLWKWLIL